MRITESRRGSHCPPGATMSPSQSGGVRMSKGPWIKIAPPEEAAGDLKRAYDRVRTTRGHIPEIRAVMAGEPLTLEAFAAFYPDNNYLCTSIDRRLAEM